MGSGITKRHNVFWGTHGCKRAKGHANPCICYCGCFLPEGHYWVFGDDYKTAVSKPLWK